MILQPLQQKIISPPSAFGSDLTPYPRPPSGELRKGEMTKHFAVRSVFQQSSSRPLLVQSPESFMAFQNIQKPIPIYVIIPHIGKVRGVFHSLAFLRYRRGNPPVLVSFADDLHLVSYPLFSCSLGDSARRAWLLR